MSKMSEIEIIKIHAIGICANRKEGNINSAIT
jgi:hypothetical protein